MASISARAAQTTWKTFITSSPRWLITFTAMRPDLGLSKARDVLPRGFLPAMVEGLDRLGGGLLDLAGHGVYSQPSPSRSSSRLNVVRMASHDDYVTHAICRQRGSSCLHGSRGQRMQDADRPA